MGRFKQPEMEAAEQAQQLVDWAKYAPMGHRGVSLNRPHTDFEKVDGRTYMEQSNRGTVLMAQIESREGVEHVAEIMAVDGIDLALIGPNDMSQDYGLLGQYTHPEMEAAFAKVVAGAQASGKRAGGHFSGAAALKPWLDRGMTVNMWNSDLGMLKAGSAGMAELR